MTRRHFRPRRPRLLLAGALLALLAACGRQAPTTPTVQAPAAFDTVVATTLRAPSIDAEGLLQAALGAPLQRRTEVVVNRHDPDRRDRVHALDYGSARAVVYEAVALGRSYLLELEIEGGYRGPDGIGIGSARSEVLAAYGADLVEEGDALILTLAPTGDRLRLAFADDRVVRMVWRFYAG